MLFVFVVLHKSYNNISQGIFSSTKSESHHDLVGDHHTKRSVPQFVTRILMFVHTDHNCHTNWTKTTILRNSQNNGSMRKLNIAIIHALSQNT